MSGGRDDVNDAQHARLLEGLAASIREKGFAQTQVTDIVHHARASRRAFYKRFPDNLTQVPRAAPRPTTAGAAAWSAA